MLLAYNIYIITDYVKFVNGFIEKSFDIIRQKLRGYDGEFGFAW